MPDGWVAEVLVNRTTGNVVDGHLRIELALTRQERTVPVTYVELTQAEEALVLATPQDARLSRRPAASEARALLTTPARGGPAEEATLPIARWASIHPRPASQK